MCADTLQNQKFEMHPAPGTAQSDAFRFQMAVPITPNASHPT